MDLAGDEVPITGCDRCGLSEDEVVQSNVLTRSGLTGVLACRPHPRSFVSVPRSIGRRPPGTELAELLVMRTLLAVSTMLTTLERLLSGLPA